MSNCSKRSHIESSQMVSDLIHNLENSIKTLEIIELGTLIKVLKSKNIELRNFISLLQIHLPTVPLLFSDILILQELPFRIWGIVIDLTKQFSKDHDSIIDDLAQIVVDLDELAKQSIVSRPIKISERRIKSVPKLVDVVSANSVSEDKYEEVSNISNHSSLISTDPALFTEQFIDDATLSIPINSSSKDLHVAASYVKLDCFDMHPFVDVNDIDLKFGSYSTLLNYFYKEEKWVKAYKILVEMIEREFRPNGFHFCLNDLRLAQILLAGNDLFFSNNIFVLQIFLEHKNACLSYVATTCENVDIVKKSFVSMLILKPKVKWKDKFNPKALLLEHIINIGGKEVLILDPGDLCMAFDTFRRCRAYVNPYVTFTDGGRKWRCNLCTLLNDVPGKYSSSLDANGRRYNIEQRPELIKGSVEFFVPTKYMVRPHMPSLYFFVIDESATAVQSGELKLITKTINSFLDELLGFPRTQIGFLILDNTLHFYCLKSSLTQPQMMVVADLDDIFLPLPNDFLVKLSNWRHVVEIFLDILPTMFQLSTNVESAFGPAFKAAFMVVSQLGGKLLIFQSTLPSLSIGRLRLRGDDSRVYEADREHKARIPEDPFYNQVAAEFTKTQIPMDIYAFSNKYSDIASLGSLTNYTGCQIYYYPSFNLSIHEEKLKHELARDITRETAWEGVMHIRCGKGVQFTTYNGHLVLGSTSLLALPAVDYDKAFAMQLTLDETLMTTQIVYFQVALLYTSSSSERQIRVHIAAAHVVTDLDEMYHEADTSAIISLLSKLAIENTLSHKLEDAHMLIQLKVVKSLTEYRNLHAMQHRLSSLILFPESLKYLALYAFSLSRIVALRDGFNDTYIGYFSTKIEYVDIMKNLNEFVYDSISRVKWKDTDYTLYAKDLIKCKLVVHAKKVLIFDPGSYIRSERNVARYFDLEDKVIL